MEKKLVRRDFATKAVHAGKTPVNVVTRPEVPPIYQTSVFAFKDIEQVDAVLTQGEGFIYSRYNNPNREILARALADLCEAESAVTTASGMGAIAAALLAALHKGDHVVVSHEVYGGTYTLFAHDLTELGINVQFVDMCDLEAVAQAIGAQTKVIYLETITNPTMKVADIHAIIALAHAHNVQVFVDNTFASPAVFRPLTYGADVVIHSLTKYVNGHSDVTAGAVLGRTAFCELVNEKVKSFGASLAPFDAWLILRGLKTLPLRMTRISENALQVANFLAKHEKVNLVNYPLHSSHPQYVLAQQQFRQGASGMLTFEVKGGLQGANAFIKACQLIEFVPSLAGVATTLLHPVSTSHRPMPKEQRLKLGITDGLIRLSVGIEPMEAIIEDLAQALDQI